MNTIPSVLVMGRPNVGKSTFINKLIHKNKAITLDQPGVTRDIASFLTDWNGKSFAVLDSGGVFFEDVEDLYLQPEVEALVRSSAQSAHKIIFLVDFKEGLHPFDRSIARFLRDFQDKVLLVVNKVDDPSWSGQVANFYQLGLGKPYPISSVHGSGIGDVLDQVVDDFPKGILLEDRIKIAIVGRPNVGKSSLLNVILDEKRSIVDSKAGTTRDPVESDFRFNGQNYTLIDTAGLRKKAKIEDGVEYYSAIRTARAIESADVVVMVVSADQMIGEQDKKIVNQVIEAGRPMVVFVNKWDLTPRTDLARKDLLHIAQSELPALAHYPFVFGSAKEDVHVTRLLEWLPVLFEGAKHRVSTAELNRFIELVIKKNPPPSKAGERIKIFYGTQVQASPPVFLFFINRETKVSPDYQRFVEKRLRHFFPVFEGITLQLHFKARSKVVLEKRVAKKSQR